LLEPKDKSEVSADAAKISWSLNSSLREDAWFVIDLFKSVDGKPFGDPLQFATKDKSIVVSNKSITDGVKSPSVATFTCTISIKIDTGKTNIDGSKVWDPTPVAVSQPFSFTWRAPTPAK